MASGDSGSVSRSGASGASGVGSADGASGGGGDGFEDGELMTMTAVGELVWLSEWVSGWVGYVSA